MSPSTRTYLIRNPQHLDWAFGERYSLRLPESMQFPGTANDTSITDIVTGTAPTALPTMGIAMDDGTIATVINTAASLEVTKEMAAWIDEVH